MTAWYSTGTVAIANGGTTVTGTGTDFVANTAAGEGIRLPDGLIYEITAIASATSLTIAPEYAGTTVSSGGAYKIAPMEGWPRNLLLQTAQLINDYASVRDNAGAGLFGDGSSGAPGVRFASDPDTGLRRTGTNAQALVCGGGDIIGVSTTIARVNADLQVNYSAAAGVHVIAKNVANDAGAAVLAVQGLAAGEGQAITGAFCAVTGTGYSPTATALALNKDATTNRSINAAGTVGASGADPAEYQFKSDGCAEIAKGQVVGIDASDRITMVWADAIDVAIKTVDPTFVGADRWSRTARIEAIYGTPHPGFPPALAENATPEQQAAFDAALAAWTEAKADFDAALETERQKVDRISHGGGRLPCIVSGAVVAGQYVIAQEDGDGGIEAVCAATVADADRWRIVGRVRIAGPTEEQIRELIDEDIPINPAWSAIVVQMKA